MPFCIVGFDPQRNRNHMNMKNTHDANKSNRPEEPNPSLPICTVSFFCLNAHLVYLHTSMDLLDPFMYATINLQHIR